MSAAALGFSAMLLVIFAGNFTIHRFSASLPPMHFALVDQQGNRVTESDFAGTPQLVFFGFTGCSSICPLTLAELSDVEEALKQQGQHVGILFITIDPIHDSPAVLASYLKNFPAPITGLTGSKAELAAVYKAFRVFPGVQSAKDRGDADHSGFIYLMNANGRFIRQFTAQMDAPAMARSIAQSLSAKEFL